MTKKLLNIINFIMFQTIWFVTAWGMTNNLEYIGIISIIISALVHMKISKQKVNTFVFYLSALIIGIVTDTIFLKTNCIYIPDHHNIILKKLCLAGLWINFATTFEYSLNWIQKRYLLAMSLAFFGGPLAYYSGSKIGAIEIYDPAILSYIKIGVLWCVAMALLMFIFNKAKAIKI